LQDQKESKNLGLLKTAKNRRAILAGRNEVEPVFLCFKLLYTNPLCVALPFRLRFFFIRLLPVFLTLFLECRSSPENHNLINYDYIVGYPGLLDCKNTNCWC
jgi:hypothetical protein